MLALYSAIAAHLTTSYGEFFVSTSERFTAEDGRIKVCYVSTASGYVGVKVEFRSYEETHSEIEVKVMVEASSVGLSERGTELLVGNLQHAQEIVASIKRFVQHYRSVTGDDCREVWF